MSIANPDIPSLLDDATQAIVFDWFEENFASIIAGAVAEHGKTGVMPDRIPGLMVPRPAAQDPATSPETKDEETPSP